MNNVSLDKIVIATNYLRPMVSPTRITITTTDVTTTSDLLREKFGNDTVHVGLGGAVSTGRLVDPVLDEFVEDKPQTIIIECYGDCMRSLADMFSHKMHSETVIIIVDNGQKHLSEMFPIHVPPVLLGRTVQFNVEEETAA